MFGREPRLTVDNMFPLCTESLGYYMQNVKQALDWAWNKATENSTKARENQKKYYDKRVRGEEGGGTLMIGDKVLVRNCSFDEPHKLHDKWSADIHTVKEQPDPMTPVFVVEPDNGGGRDNETSKSSSATPKPVLREDGVKDTTSELEGGEDRVESDSDDDEFAILVPESNAQIPESCLCAPTRGRPRTTLPTVLNRDLALIDHEIRLHSSDELEKITALARDRRQWHEMTVKIERAAKALQTENWDVPRH
ncbi:Pol polyprotein [Elysia marginata]|uniref:Pol polyprotein n=1 Tax=Elysia marginata TaxID=1093978 RepID=A0AAV4F5W9_9GAST|nr:Pol polyprotein [Elysia marginata]